MPAGPARFDVPLGTPAERRPAFGLREAHAGHERDAGRFITWKRASAWKFGAEKPEWPAGVSFRATFSLRGMGRYEDAALAVFRTITARSTLRVSTGSAAGHRVCELGLRLAHERTGRGIPGQMGD